MPPKRASNEILVDFMMKRSINQSSFVTKQNFKSRWFVLDEESIKYFDGSLAKRGKLKGTILLNRVKTIEAVDEGKLEDKTHVFQVMYGNDKGDFYTLYIIALNIEQRTKWLEAIKQAVKVKGTDLLPKYHPGVWTKSLARYNCCDQIDRNAPGCKMLPEVEAATSNGNNSPGGVSKRLGPLPNPPAPSPGVAPTKPVPKAPESEKKIFIAAYDYKPSEEGDLELVVGEEYEILDDHMEYWWQAKNKKGETGYIPSNYVKKKFDLEIYEWYYKGVTRDRSETILKAEGKEGCFLIRDSSQPGKFTLSIYTCEGRDNQVRHYHIKKNDANQFYLAEKHSFVSIPDLIYYHKHNAAGIATRLKNPPSRNKNAPVTAGLGHSRWEIDPKEIDIFEILGAGCFGTVHKGKMKNRVVAVKMMKERAMSEESFLEEAKTMTQLSHPNLVQLYGVVTRSKPLKIVTEFMQSGSLLTFLKRHKVSLLQRISTLLDMCIQVCAGMEYLENRGFIHRDLAARNCLVGDNHVIKVADFGLARYVIDDEYTSSSGAKFPVKWAPPEVLSYTRFSSKSDIWAFGILMWEIFTGGAMPYDNMRNFDVVHFIVDQRKRLEKPPACTPKIYNIMLECWHHDAEKRPAFVNLMTALSGLMETGNYPMVQLQGR